MYKGVFINFNWFCGRMVIDGDIALDQVDMELLKTPMSIPKEFLTNMFIMRMSHPESVKIANYYSMMGKMTDVNIWNNSLSIEQMKNWTRCVSDEGGNVINWETAEWEMDGLKEEVLTRQEICQPDKTTVWFE